MPRRRKWVAARVATSWVGKQAVAVQSTPKNRRRVPAPSTKWPPLARMNPRDPAGASLRAPRSTSPVGALIPRAGNGNQCCGSCASSTGLAAAGGGAGAAGGELGATFAAVAGEGAGGGAGTRQADNRSAASASGGFIS